MTISTAFWLHLGSRTHRYVILNTANWLLLGSTTHRYATRNTTTRFGVGSRPKILLIHTVGESYPGVCGIWVPEWDGTFQPDNVGTRRVVLAQLACRPAQLPVHVFLEISTMPRFRLRGLVSSRQMLGS